MSSASVWLLLPGVDEAPRARNRRVLKRVQLVERVKNRVMKTASDPGSIMLGL